MLNAWEGGNDHGLFSAGDEPGVAKWSPRPSFYYLYFLFKLQGDRLVATESGDTSIRAYGTTWSSGEVNVTLVNVSPVARTVRVNGKGYTPGKRYYWYSLKGGDDNGDDYATLPAWSASTAGGVVVRVPGHGAVCLTIEKR